MRVGAGVPGRLSAASLRRGDFDIAAGELEKPESGKAHLRTDEVHEAGHEQPHARAIGHRAPIGEEKERPCLGARRGRFKRASGGLGIPNPSE